MEKYTGSDTHWEEKSAEVRAESSGSVSEVTLSNHHCFLFKATKTKKVLLNLSAEWTLPSLTFHDLFFQSMPLNIILRLFLMWPILKVFIEFCYNTASMCRDPPGSPCSGR